MGLDERIAGIRVAMAGQLAYRIVMVFCARLGLDAALDFFILARTMVAGSGALARVWRPMIRWLSGPFDLVAGAPRSQATAARFQNSNFISDVVAQQRRRTPVR